jgi:hypothetical protein
MSPSWLEKHEAPLGVGGVRASPRYPCQDRPAPCPPFCAPRRPCRGLPCVKST